MALELLAGIIAAIAFAGVAMALRQLTGARLPRWIVPASAGLGMFAFSVWNEYDWYDRVSSRLPAGVTIAWTNTDSALWRPWTYVYPITTRFVAVDTRSLRRLPAVPDQVLADVLFSGRWEASLVMPVAFDCRAARRAELVQDGITIGEDGRIIGATWHNLAADDPILRTACDGG